MLSRKNLGIAASLMMILSSNNVYARTIIDMPNDWSRIPLENGINNGLFQGTEKGLINAGGNLTKAEMATIMNRVLSLNKRADLKKYRDMSKDKWYYNEIAKSVEAGLIEGQGSRMVPEARVTREEAFTIIARAMNLESRAGFGRNFDDANEISYWAQESIGGLAERGYIQGYKGKINPKGHITRAEFAKVLDSSFKDYIRMPGIYTEMVTGNIVVNTRDVELENLMIAGDLIISEGVGTGKISLSNVGVTGRIVMRGGGRLYLEDGSNTDLILVDNKLTNSKVNIKSDSKVDLVELRSPASLDGDGQVRDIEAKKGSNGSRIYIINTNIDVETGVKDIKDRLGLVIKPGSDLDINKDSEKLHDEALADFRDLKYQARILNDREVNKVLEKVELINKDSSLAEIQKAIRDLEREIKDLEIKESNRQSYYNRLERLREEAETINFAEIGPVLSKYAAVDIRSNIRLIIDAVEELEEVSTRGKKTLAEKAREYKKLEDLRKRAEEINDSELTTIVGRYNYLSQESTLEDLKEAIKTIESDLKRIEKENKEKEHEASFKRLENLIEEAEKAINRSENYKPGKPGGEKTEKEIKEELIEKIKKDYGKLTIESSRSDIDKAIASVEGIIKEADKGSDEQKGLYEQLEIYRSEAKETKNEDYRDKINEYKKLDENSIILDLKNATGEIRKFREVEFAGIVSHLGEYQVSINNLITENFKELEEKPEETEIKLLVEDNLAIPDKDIVTVQSVDIKEKDGKLNMIVYLKEDVIVKEIKIDEIELKKE